MIKITNLPIDEGEVLQSVKSENAGACVLFAGTTRRFTGDKETRSLSYQAYDEMAKTQLSRLRKSAIEKWSLCDCSIAHRIGEVNIGQTSVVVATSSPHRTDAFNAAAWIMDELKKEIPIWKKEVWSDGTNEWIHPGNETIQSAERS